MTSVTSVRSIALATLVAFVLFTGMAPLCPCTCCKPKHSDAKPAKAGSASAGEGACCASDATEPRTSGQRQSATGAPGSPAVKACLCDGLPAAMDPAISTQHPSAPKAPCGALPGQLAISPQSPFALAFEGHRPAAVGLSSPAPFLANCALLC